MSAVIDDPTADSQTEYDHDDVPAGTLQDRFPEYLKLTRRSFFVVAGLAVVYWGLAFLPVWHTDVWGHLAYGKMIVAEGAIPATEPMMPLAHGVRFVDTHWLSQVIGFLAFERYGVSALQAMHALLLSLAVAMIAFRISHRTQSAAWAMFATALFLWAGWQQIHIARPQTAGLLLYCSVLFLLTGRERRTLNWIVTPLLFAVWANVHGSFMMGLGLIGLYGVARAVDLLRRTGSVRALLHDRRLTTAVVMLELAAAAVLLNPYGFELYREVLSFGNNSNLASVPEWSPLTIDMVMGRWLVGLSLLLVFSYRFTPRRVSTFEVLLLIGTTLGALWMARLYVWWFPVAVLYLCWNGHAILSRRLKTVRAESPRNGLWAVVSVGLMWIGFAYTPFGFRMLHDIEPKLENAVSRQTPIKLAAYLNEHPPEGLVYNTFDYGDYLLWAGPPDIKLFAMSHLHLIPTDVWNDYIRTLRVSDRWDETLDRYGVNTVIVDRNRDRGLMLKLAKMDDWKVDYVDAQAVLLQRKPPN